MARSDSALQVVSPGDTAWRVKHALPGRLRFTAASLRAAPAQCDAVRQFLTRQPGILAVNTNPRLGSVTLHYSQHRLSRREVDALIAAVLAQRQATPIGSDAAPGFADRERLMLLGAGLAASPFLPTPLRYAVTLAAITPTLWESTLRLREGRGASAALDAGALLLATAAGRCGVAQVNNLMHHFTRQLEQRTVAETEQELRQRARPEQLMFRTSPDPDQPSREAQSLRAGDRLHLGGGELAPVEGIVVSGFARIREGFTRDESDTGPGRRVTAGSYLLEGELELALLQDWDDGNFARLAAFVELAIHDREDHQLYAAGLADRLAPITALTSAAVYGFTQDLARTSSAAAADFSAATAMVAPVGVEATVCAGAARGMLFRGGHAIEALAQVDTLVFDRSGTLTRGEWQLDAILPQDGYAAGDCNDLLGLLVYEQCRGAAALPEQGTAPPLLGLSHAEIERVQQRGLHQRQGKHLLALVTVETARQDFKLDLADLTDMDSGQLECCLLVNGECAARIILSDSLSPNNTQALEALRTQGITRCYLVTREEPGQLHTQLSALPFDAVHTGLDELDKLAVVQDLQRSGRRVALVSDGLFRAGGECLNICLGSSLEARPLDADLWLMSPDIQQLARAHALAQAARHRLRDSQRLAQAGKGAALLASSFELIPPTLAAALGHGVTLAMMNYARSINRGDTG